MAIAITSDKTVIVEMAQIDEEHVMPDLLWIGSTGILNDLTEDDYAQIRDGLRQMMVYSTDKAVSSKPCCLLERQIGPMAYANGTRLEYINTVKLPPQPLALTAPMSAVVNSMPANGSGAAENGKGAGEALPVAPNAGQMPAAVPAAKTGLSQPAPGQGNAEGAGGQPAVSGQGARSDLAYSGAAPAETKQEPFQFLPIVATVMLIAIAAMFLLRQHTVALQEESPEVRMALANETRLAIMEQLEEVERIPTDISSRIGKSKATISEHLEQLVQAGLVEKDQMPGRKFVFYRLSQKGKTILLRRKFAA